MIARISSRPCHGTIKVPPSKSYTHRAIICAALAAGTSHISNVSYSNDIRATINAMRHFGAVISEGEDSLIIEGNSNFHLHNNVIDCDESGSTLRFLIPLSSLSGKEVIFTGKEKLFQRPMDIYQQLFSSPGITFTHTSEQVSVEGSLQPNEYVLDGNISSQFVSGLLFALPLLWEDSTISIKEPFESKSYVRITIAVLRAFGIEIEVIDDNHYLIPGKQQYKPCDYQIEGDYSQFAFFAVLAAINNCLDVVGVKHDSLQGDKVILDFIREYGALIEEIPEGYRISPAKRNGFSADLQDCPDLGPVLMVLASTASSSSILKNVNRLRLKESDRIEAMKKELEKLSISVEEGNNEIKISGKILPILSSNIFSSHNDHRIVMSMAVLAATLLNSSIICGAEAVNKSYPKFFDDLQSLEIAVVLEDEIGE